MTATVPSLQPASRTAAGVACIVASMMLFVGQDALMKSFLGPYTVWMLIAARGLIAFVTLVPLILVLGAPHRLFTPLWPLHLLRGTLFAVGFACFYAAFPFMGLAEVTTIFFAAPLMTAVIAWAFLGEDIGPQRGICLVIGFAGIVIAMNPTGEGFSWVAFLPIFCALTYAISQVIARRIGERETTLTLGLHTIVPAGLLILPMGWLTAQIVPQTPDLAHLHWRWVLPEGTGLWPPLAVGTIGMVAYMLASRAYQIASASLIAPFDYSYLPFAAVLAWWLWGEVPETHTLTGMVMIIASGLYLGYREIRAAGRRSTPVPTGEVSFVPSAPVGAVVHASDTAPLERDPL